MSISDPITRHALETSAHGVLELSSLNLKAKEDKVYTKNKVREPASSILAGFSH